MVWNSVECPHCGSRHQFFFGPSREHHLRQCPSSNRWFVAYAESTDSGREYRIDPLDHPPTCPVDGCDEVVPSERLPPHIIENHDGSIA